MTAAGEALASPRPGAGAAPGRGVVAPLALRAFEDARTRTIAFAVVFALYAYIQPVGYRHAYPTVADRLAFAHSFAGNDALRLFYGYPFAVTTVAGYSAWRVGGTLAIAAAAFGVLAAVRALRGEEDSGRSELVLSGAVRRGELFGSAMLAVGAGGLVLWAAQLAGYVLGGLPAGGSAYLALATTSCVAVFAGVGALTSQFAPTRRLALELGMGALAVSLLLRVAADTSPDVAWLRWATPLGWAEEMRPFAGPRPAVLALPAAASALALLAAYRISLGRDIGTGLLAGGESASPRTRLLGSVSAQALRTQGSSLAAWAGGTGAFAAVLGVVSASVGSAGISPGVSREIAKLGAGSIATPSGYLAFVFLFFALVLSLFACAQVNALRHEEAAGRLETLLVLPLSRVRWLAGRLLPAVLAAFAIALLSGLLAWAGAASEGVTVSLPRMLEAGANCLPVATLFGGLAVLAYGFVPRATAGIAYGLVAIAFLWQLVGSLLGVPRWLLDATPFAHIGFVPAQPFRAVDAVAMVAIGLAAAAAGAAAFTRRDLVEE